MAWIEMRFRILSIATLFAGFFVWFLGRVLAIPLPWWRLHFGEVIADLVSILNMTMAPLLAMFTLICGIILIGYGISKMPGTKGPVIAASVGAILALLYLVYQFVCLMLLWTMDF